MALSSCVRGPEEMRTGMAESFGFSFVMDEASATFLSRKVWRELGTGDVMGQAAGRLLGLFSTLTLPFWINT